MPWRARISSVPAETIRPSVASPMNRSIARTATTTRGSMSPVSPPPATNPRATSDADRNVRNIGPREKASL